MELALVFYDFIGPDGTVNSYYYTSPETIREGHNGHISLQFKLFLNTNGRSTPVLHEFIVDYNILPDAPTQLNPGDKTMINDSTPLFEWIFNDLDGSQSGFQVILDDDINFDSINYDSNKVSFETESWTPDAPIKDGLWYWKVRVMDDSFDWGPYSNYFILNIDSTPPRPFVPELDFSIWTSSYLNQISFSTMDDKSGVDHYEVRIDNGSFIQTTSPYTIGTQEEGVHNITIRAYDKAGNYRDVAIDVYIDTTSPEILHIPTTEAYKGNDIEIEATVTDYGAGVNNVILHYKQKIVVDYKYIVMKGSEDYYTATIPGADIKSDLEYYIEASDKSYPSNVKYFGRNGESSIIPSWQNDIDMNIKEGETPGIISGLSTPIGSFVIVLIVAVVVVLLILYRRKPRVTEEVKEEPPPEPPETPEPAEPPPEVPHPPVKMKRPQYQKDTFHAPKKKKEKYLEQPPEPTPDMTEFLEKKTSMIKFTCSYCGKKSIVQVSKDYNSVLCPHCVKETEIG
jgi:hypothetical protein